MLTAYALFTIHLIISIYFYKITMIRWTYQTLNLKNNILQCLQKPPRQRDLSGSPFQAVRQLFVELTCQWVSWPCDVCGCFRYARCGRGGCQNRGPKLSITTAGPRSRWVLSHLSTTQGVSSLHAKLNDGHRSVFIFLVTRITRPHV